jgi:hypothetical protein
MRRFIKDAVAAANVSMAVNYHPNTLSDSFAVADTLQTHKKAVNRNLARRPPRGLTPAVKFA